jgi:hypothetical protein
MVSEKPLKSTPECRHDGSAKQDCQVRRPCHRVATLSNRETGSAHSRRNIAITLIDPGSPILNECKRLFSSTDNYIRNGDGFAESCIDQ